MFDLFASFFVCLAATFKHLKGRSGEKVAFRWSTVDSNGFKAIRTLVLTRG